MDDGEPGHIQYIVATSNHLILEEVPRLKPIYLFSRSQMVTADAGLVGQHTEKVLGEYGYSASQIAALEKERVILLG